MDSLTPEQRQALQEAPQEAINAAARHAQQTQVELHERLQFLHQELERARGGRRPDAGLTGKPMPLPKNGGNWEEFNMKVKAFVGLRSEELVKEMERMEEPGATDPSLGGLTGDLGAENRNLYGDLTMLTTGTSLKQIKGVGNNKGWRRTGSCASHGTPACVEGPWRGYSRSCAGTSATQR